MGSLHGPGRGSSQGAVRGEIGCRAGKRVVSGQGQGKTPEVGPTSAMFLLCDHGQGIFLLYASVSPSVLVSLCNRWPLGISLSGIVKGLQRSRAEIGTPQRPTLSCLQLLLQVPASDPPFPPHSVEL